MKPQTTPPSPVGPVRQLLGICCWIALDALLSWVWSMAGARLAAWLGWRWDGQGPSCVEREG